MSLPTAFTCRSSPSTVTSHVARHYRPSLHISLIAVDCRFTCRSLLTVAISYCIICQGVGVVSHCILSHRSVVASHPWVGTVSHRGGSSRRLALRWWVGVASCSWESSNWSTGRPSVALVEGVLAHLKSANFDFLSSPHYRKRNCDFPLSILSRSGFLPRASSTRNHERSCTITRSKPQALTLHLSIWAAGPGTCL